MRGNPALGFLQLPPGLVVSDSGTPQAHETNGAYAVSPQDSSWESQLRFLRLEILVLIPGYIFKKEGIISVHSIHFSNMGF